MTLQTELLKSLEWILQSVLQDLVGLFEKALQSLLLELPVAPVVSATVLAQASRFVFLLEQFVPIAPEDVWVLRDGFSLLFS